MGVPKFYRWLSERYPCLSEVVKEHQLPEFDNLYLDMNGIIHNCSHPNDDDPHFRITEEKIFQDIFHYIEVLFRMIQPRKVFFMAIDGVAPRAKMNQQRGRRFRSAREAEMNENKARDRGEDLPKEARFDSNCITPGTPFMCRLHEQLKYFVVSKMSTDTTWQGVRVILSGHETPGEGEHKIMDFIRYEKSKPAYDPNIRHCLYGLDADLVMLGLCTHDPHFSLLREEVRFGGRKGSQKRIVTAEETTFHLLHLSLLREYLDHEFGDLRKGSMSFDYDLECIIDDWILLGFLVGNDFIPNLPHLHINKGALSDLYMTYKRVLPTLGGYMNGGGILNLKRFEKFMGALSETEMDRFDEIYSDTKWLEGKTASKQKRRTIKPTPGPADVHALLMGEPEAGAAALEVVELINSNASPIDFELQKLIQSADAILQEDGDESPGAAVAATAANDFDEQTTRDNAYQMEFQQHKRAYYMDKMNYEEVTPAVLKEQAEGYVRAIQWNLHYYYNGCMSWSWFYEHHFTPWITDIKHFADMDLIFEMSKPFLPFEQLLSVLPSASKDLLPRELQGLMVNQSSPIIDYYPEDFACDLNGKQQDWEAVVLIPFIDEERLLGAVRPLYQYLKPEAKARNKQGPMISYSYRTESLGHYTAPQYFPLIENNHAEPTDVWRSEWELEISKLRKGLMPNVRLDVFFPGFPTLEHIPHRASLKAEGVRVFEQSSRGKNMILTLEDQGRPDIHEVAEQLLGEEIWVSWPHMVEARVIGLSDANFKYTLRKERNGQEFKSSKKNEEWDQKEFHIQVKAISSRYKDRWGVTVGETHITVEACVMTGRKYICGQKGKITLEKQWSKIPQPFALQTIRKDILVHDKSFTQYRTLSELFPVGSICFMLGEQQYGCQGTVKQISPEHKGRIQLEFMEPKDVDLSEVIKRKRELTLMYLPGFKAAQQLSIGSHLLSRITGSIFVQKGPKEADSEYANRINIGLNLKFNKKNEEVCGYTKRDNNGWMYSSNTIQIVSQYISLFPELFDYLAKGKNVQSDNYHHMDVFPDGDGEAKLKTIADWLKELPCTSAGRQPCGTLALDDGVVAAVEETVEQQKSERGKMITMQVKPHLLYKPNLSQGSSLPDPDTTFRLLDRVVNVREGFSVPLGLRGTVTGIHAGSRPEETIMEVLFDNEFSGGLAIRSSTNRSYRMPGSALINFNHAQRVLNRANRNPHQKPTAVVPPMRDSQADVNPNQTNYWQQRKANYLQETEEQRKQQSSKTPLRRSESKENSPLAAVATKFVHNTGPNMTPPDPKKLPKPSFQVNATTTKHSAHDLSIKNHREQQKLEKIWQSLEGDIDYDTSQRGTEKSHTQNLSTEQNMSEQLKSILNISGAQSEHAITKTRQEVPEAEFVQPNVQTFFAAASAAGACALPKPAKERPIMNSEIPEAKVVQGGNVHDLMVPLQVSMKHVKQKNPPKKNIKTDTAQEDDSDSTEEKVRKWLSQGENFQQQREKGHSKNEQSKSGHSIRQQQKNSQDRTECNDSTKTTKKSGRRRLAANFGPT